VAEAAGTSGRPGRESLDAEVERVPDGPYVGVHRARRPALRRWAPVIVVLLAAALAVLVVRLWFALGA
jgi:hypothetical protein